MSLRHRLKAAYSEYLRSKRRGPLAQAVLLALRLLSIPYCLAVSLRNGLYDRKLLRSSWLAVPVVSVGNLCTGGTGKTPLVEWVCRFYRSLQLEPVVLSRGYGRGPASKSDEVLLYEENLPGVRHYEGKDRVQAAARAISEGRPDLFVLDDGFQHRRLARDLDVVVIDARRPPGEDRLLPAGTLREPANAVRRAHVVVISRADLVEHEQLERLSGWAQQEAGAAAVVVTRYEPRALRRVPAGREEALDRARRARAGAFCGIGWPDNFLGTLRAVGVEPAPWRAFPDHHWYSDEELRELAESGAELLLTTQKDAVRIGPRWTYPTPLYAVLADVQFLSGRERFERLLREAVIRDGGQAKA